MRIEGIQKGLGNLRELVVDLVVYAPSDQREGFDQTLDVRILALARLECEPLRNLTPVGSELLAQVPDEAEFVFVIRKQIFLQRFSPTTTKCPVSGCNKVSKLTGSGAGSIRRNPSTRKRKARSVSRSEEHTSELQSLRHLVCRL